MASSPSELTLDCKPQTSYSMLLKSFGDNHQNQNIDETQKLEEVLSLLQEERLKIEAFKRELPLCMQLLTNAVEASRQQLQSYVGNEGSSSRAVVLEEFIPLKNSNNSENNSENICDNKANWMTSAQLWSQQEGNESTLITVISPKEAADHHHHHIGNFNVSPKLVDGKQMRNGGADLSLASSVNKDMEEDQIKVGSGGIVEQDIIKGITCNSNNSTGGEGQSTGNNQPQPHRKARRCWSPDLHRRFVNALHMLGGSQVATPKQIRELMKVEGLTNDEVKSHLQKYRLHTRRPSPSPQAAAGGGAPTTQLVVLGGIWVPSEYATAAAHTGGVPTLYGAAHHPHHPPPHFYTAPAAAAASPPAPAQLQQHLHHQLHMYNKATAAQAPESDVRGGGDRSDESIEDGKSESSSGGSGDQRKGLAVLRLEDRR